MKSIKWISILCAIMLIIAILPLPIGYYNILRVVIFLGALFVGISNMGKTYWFITFLLIAIIFNPFLPIYLKEKSIWIPLDIISAICFIIIGINISKQKENQNQESSDESDSLQRDKIFNK
ncbi:DUF6804 family protein [Jejudonia soesokkakensis]|uniref:DUF6804 family protein n=1 Tax=Jejudonia soesokkakensis TaxID=1323432 RepID=A0ABW2MRG4_9FLAO